jgi:hypothetical protein
VVLQAVAIVPPVSAASSLCFGRMVRLSSRRMPGPNGCGNVTTTVRASGVATVSGSPSTSRLLASTLLTRGSNTAAKVKATSAAENGTPSDHVSPSRSVRVCTRLSGDEVHDSASHGSTSCVAMFTRTSRACVSSVKSCAG